MMLRQLAWNARALLHLATLGGLLVAAAGCGHGSNAQSSSTATPSAAAVASAANAGRGKAIYAANCAACHGPTGVEGGVGPSLRDEHKRKDLARAIAQIENPQPPMAKLYPVPLSAADVADVAAYVESL